jgi:protein-S-isoprenylcysteine O-methyltransferase Ste14
LAWAILVFIINTVYFIFSEEPGLQKRFGEEYVEYKKNVPRWIPRLKPWKPMES